MATRKRSRAAVRTAEERPLLFVNAAQVVTCAGPARSRRGPEMKELAIAKNVAVLAANGVVKAVGPRAELRALAKSVAEVDCKGGVLMPAMVDSHTHAVFGAARYAEHEMRASGMDYMQIARQGGGIHSSVRDVRERSERELVELARNRLRRLASFGVGTIEVKSGYGLSLEDELKLLRVIQKLARELPIRLVPTFLGAHEVPLEYREPSSRRREYIELVVREMIPRVAADKLARFADVFCETGVYTADESREILNAAKAAGLGLKLHADELTACGGAELAAQVGATSADHLAAISEAGVRALAGGGTVATLLPATMVFLGKTGQAPARRLINAGIPVALATDFNPGTSPTMGLPLVLTLGVSQLRLSAAESIIAATVNGAAAVGLADRVGQISPGFEADLALFDASDFREVPYWLGARLCRELWTRGKACGLHNLDVI